MLKAIKVRIYPTIVQKQIISKQLGCCRKIYNLLLDYKKTEWEQNKHSVGLKDMGKYLTELKTKDEYFYLNEVHSKVLQQSMQDLNKAFDNFFKSLKKDKSVGYPKFKSKHDNKQSCRFPSDIFNRTNYKCDKIKGNRITLIKQLSDIHFKCSKRDEKYLNKKQQYIRSVTLSKTSSNKYYLSVLIDYQQIKYEPIDTIIGLDLGIKDFCVDSNGNRYENKHFYKNSEKRIKFLSKQLNRKQKGSKNKNKARIKLAKLYEKITNKRNNYLHQISSMLVNENQVICIEDLNVKGMMSNHHLAKSIQDLGLYEFRRQLEYKCQFYGRYLVVIDRFYPSSKTCHECGFINSKLTLNDREWICPVCGKHIDRDYNAALNILDEGLKLFNRI